MKEKLRKLQLTQLEMLKIIDEICKKYHIKYSLYGGTLLGAVRHKGFIPWDDDLDICMERSEYDRFIAIWEKVGPAGYILQNKENTPNFTQSFTKIRKDYTTFLQYDFERGKYHTGIFVDIFPLDRCPNNKILKIVFKSQCMIYQLLTREFIPQEANTFVKIVSKTILTVIRPSFRSYVRTQILKKIMKNNKNKKLKFVDFSTMYYLGIEYPSEMLDCYLELQFEDEKFMCFSEWDEHLRCCFGDYMKLPPEEERDWRHHPIILDFEHSYEELQS